MRNYLQNNWRTILARLPLPMLALAASWGVYSFAALYVPTPIAIVQAAAFELTYVGLAITRDLTPEQRKRATGISIGAVVVSVLYNSIDGFFARNPTALAQLPWWGEAIGAVLHGAPLAVVAYLVADLLLHSSGTPRVDIRTPRAAPVLAQSKPVRTESISAPVVADGTCKYCGESGLSSIERARHGRQYKRVGSCRAV